MKVCAELALAALLAVAGCTGPDSRMREQRPGQTEQATVPLDAARRTALRLVSGSHILRQEIEEENGLLLYSFDIGVAGGKGVEEVQVDAHTGRVVARTHARPVADVPDTTTAGRN